MTSPNAKPYDVRPMFWSLATIAITALAACQDAVHAAPGGETKSTTPSVAAATDIDAGRYLVAIGGCNDCHTAGFAMTNGAEPASEHDRLMGDMVGFAGPWGVSYPSNLRLALDAMSEDDFVEMARRGEGRPPMPWPSLKAMSEKDLRSIYRYIVSLGPKGQQVPAPVPPGGKATTPYVVMAPVGPA
jgi:mono/diheme cytochrome c family protein